MQPAAPSVHAPHSLPPLSSSRPRPPHTTLSPAHQVVISPATGTQKIAFKWRKFAAGMYPSGAFSDAIEPQSPSFAVDGITSFFSVTNVTAGYSAELEYGVWVTFPTYANKQVSDAWTFTAYTTIPQVGRRLAKDGAGDCLMGRMADLRGWGLLHRPA